MTTIITIYKIVKINDAIKNPFCAHVISYLLYSAYLLFTSKLSTKASIVVVAYKYIRIYINVNWGVGGNWSLIVGTNSTKAIIMKAIEAILSANKPSWKNTPKFVKAISQKGRNIVTRGTKGYLWTGMFIWA